MPLVLHVPARPHAGLSLTRFLAALPGARWRDVEHDARALADRRRLLGMDERLLADMGLTRGDVRRGASLLRRGRARP